MSEKEVVKQEEVQLNVDPQTHMTITVQDFDRKIADTEAAVANLKKEKATYIYDTNVKLLMSQAKQEQQKAEEAKKTEG